MEQNLPFNVDTLLVFGKVVECRSLSRAAALLGMPKSTVSRKISRLEADLGIKLLRAQYTYPPADLTIKATGYQWYWNHEYLPKEKDGKGFGFDSVMLTPEEVAEKKAEGVPALRNLSVDNEVVVPVNKNVHVLVTAGDVLHNWTVPSFGSKVDAVPGRINATWFKATKTGIFYGQCSELCGKDHAFMPIAVRVVDEGTYGEWSAAMAAKDKKKAREILKRVALEQAGKKTEDVAAAQQ